MTREDLKALCRGEKMTHKRRSWSLTPGGLFRYMVERGEVYQEYGAKRFHRLTDFQPLSQEKQSWKSLDGILQVLGQSV